MDWAIKNLSLQIEEINCKGEKGLTKSSANNLTLQLSAAGGFGQVKLRASSFVNLER